MAEMASISTRANLLPCRIIKHISPSLFVRMQYLYLTGNVLHLSHPKRYTEKLQWLRLKGYPFDPLAIQCAGRRGMRDYASSLGLEEYLIPIYGFYENYEEIPFSNLPKSYVLKCSHASGFNQIVKPTDDREKAIKEGKEKFQKFLATDYGFLTMEPHYSSIDREIICEKYLGKDNSLPLEYKIHVFNGKAKNLYLVSGRGKDIRYDQLYINWTPFPESQFNGWRASNHLPERPAEFDDMVALAEKLAAPFPFVRVDFFLVDHKIYLNEMTFTPAKGTLKFDDDSADFIQGKWLDISEYQKKIEILKKEKH